MFTMQNYPILKPVPGWADEGRMTGRMTGHMHPSGMKETCKITVEVVQCSNCDSITSIINDFVRTCCSPVCLINIE